MSQSIASPTAIRGISTIWSTSCDLHNTTRYCRSWANLKNRFSVASAHRTTARLASVSWRLWIEPGRYRMYGVRRRNYRDASTCIHELEPDTQKPLPYRQIDCLNWPRAMLPSPGFDCPRKVRLSAAALVSTF